jgi:hypothetical protein
MRVWWVNQGQTFRQAVKDGGLWAPLVDGNGHRRDHWSRMTDVAIGDLIVHYAGGRVRGVSSARSIATEAPRIMRRRSHDQWVDDGMRIVVDFSSLEPSVPLSRIPIAARLAAVGTAGAPFDKRGEVKVGYLFRLEGALLDVLLQVLQIDPAILRAPDSEDTGYSAISSHSQPSADPRLNPNIRATIPLGPDRTSVAWVRPEQRTFRRFLFSTGGSGLCDLCGRLLPVSLLRAAHIMPRALLHVDERADLRTVMSACILGCDALFELGYLIVDETGAICRGSSRMEPKSDGAAAVNALVGRMCTAFDQISSEFFQRHRLHHAAALTGGSRLP